ncbi:MAG: transglycosylase SLT domain-containing protein [Alphaproteobacteria bacterium]|nr:transglycosylase SLT domain-containing protein [Alphaproteobacteria bacterium]
MEDKEKLQLLLETAIGIISKQVKEDKTLQKDILDRYREQLNKLVPIEEEQEPRTTVFSKKYTTEYDMNFKRYTHMYFGIGVSWEWFKAQAIAESNLDPHAVSPVGARGIMQIMPGTWDEICQKNKFNYNNPENYDHNIRCGIWYMSYLYKKWTSNRPLTDKMAFTLGSYNAGFGNILKAQKECLKRHSHKDCNRWKNIVPMGPYVNSWKHEETIGYVEKIAKLVNVYYNLEIE